MTSLIHHTLIIPLCTKHLGIHLTIDLGQPKGHRITKLDVRCADCSNSNYTKVDPKKEYSIVTVNYLIDGGDGYQGIKKHYQNQYPGKNKTFLLLNIRC